MIVCKGVELICFLSYVCMIKRPCMLLIGKTKNTMYTKKEKIITYMIYTSFTLNVIFSLLFTSQIHIILPIYFLVLFFLIMQDV